MRAARVSGWSRPSTRSRLASVALANRIADRRPVLPVRPRSTSLIDPTTMKTTAAETGTYAASATAVTARVVGGPGRSLRWAIAPASAWLA
jgi:hypothetical protein